MKRTVFLISFITSLIIFNYNNCAAQDTSRLCIYFDHHEKNMEMSFNKDSTFVVFNMLRKGFETEEQRKKATEELYKDKFHPEPPIDFYVVFHSNREPEELKTLINIDDCAAKISLVKYRENDFIYPEGVGDSKVYLIQRLQDGTLLKWNAIMMASE